MNYFTFISYLFLETLLLEITILVTASFVTKRLHSWYCASLVNPKFISGYPQWSYFWV